MRRQKTLWTLLFGIFIFVLFIGGCSGIQSPAVEKNYFSLEVKHPESSVPLGSEAVLRIQKLRIAPEYRMRNLVYRTGDLGYKADFYNEFFIAPELMITTNVRKWLEKSGLFQYVVDSSSGVESGYVLEGMITSLYGDYRDAKASQAVMEIEFFLMKEVPAFSEIVFQKRYTKKLPIKDRSPESLVKGWNEALEKILIDFEKDLRNVKLDEQ
jgi:cholesterol transport system auxiliary component